MCMYVCLLFLCLSEVAMITFGNGIYLWRTAGYSFPDLSHFRQKKSLCKFSGKQHIASGSIQLRPP